MTELAKPESLARRGGCWFSAADVQVHLGVQTDFTPAKKAHPAFVVDDLTRLRAELEAAGFPCTDDAPLAGFDRTFVSDPFGNRIERMEVKDRS